MSVNITTTDPPVYGPPKSKLGRLRLFSPSAAVKVSPLCLGAMNFGEGWKDQLGECDKATSESILDYFYDQGGNFIDTANNYQNGDSEKWIGEWMEKRGIRDEIVLATKYSSNYMAGPGHPQIMGNYLGNNSKSLHLSVEASLKKLRTTYIDLLWVHWWDYSTSIPELMQSLNHLVVNGKVLYIGISDAPAWIVSKANEYARAHGLRQFCAYQGKWSAIARDMERDIIPMCRTEGMAICPWSAMGSGRFKSAEQRKAAEGRIAQYSEADIKMSEVLEAIADRKGTVMTSVALAYVMHKAPYVYPLVGGRKLSHLEGNVGALSVDLSPEEIKEIESASSFELGWPHDFLWPKGVPESLMNIGLMKTGGAFDWVPDTKPIPHSREAQ